jgi:DNA polymerase III delta subunit
MKIIVLHGDDNLKSSLRLKTFIDVATKRGWESHRVSDNSVNLPEILSGQSLFINQKLVIIDEPKLININITKWIAVNNDKYSTTLVIYSDKKLPLTLIKSLPKNTKVEESKLPTKLWLMLDAFYPGNKKYFLSLMHEVCKSEPIEFVFSLLCKQMRDMYWLIVDENSFPQKGWRVTKLKSIAKRFEKQKLEMFINEFAEIDVKCKTSDTNLIDLLDFMVISHLE